jgi:hypothetical protein
VSLLRAKVVFALLVNMPPDELARSYTVHIDHAAVRQSPKFRSEPAGLHCCGKLYTSVYTLGTRMVRW